MRTVSTRPVAVSAVVTVVTVVTVVVVVVIVCALLLRTCRRTSLRETFAAPAPAPAPAKASAYALPNYLMARGTAGIQQDYIWKQPAVMTEPVYMQSLRTLRFADTDESAHDRIKQQSSEVVDKCVSSFRTLNREAQTVWRDADHQLELHRLAKEVHDAEKRTEALRTTYASLEELDKKLVPLLHIKCRFTVDNILLDVFYNNAHVQAGGGSYNNWTAAKTLQLTNYRMGVVIAFKCRDWESNAMNFRNSGSISHHPTAALILKSDFLDTISSDISKKYIKGNWRVYHRSDPADPHPDWYKNDFDDSSWSPPEQALSGMKLDGGKDEATYKIWGGNYDRPENKYVWFRYKERNSSWL
jgi:hypothetical protein